MSRSDRAWSGSCAVIRAILRGKGKPTQYGAPEAQHRLGGRRRMAHSLQRLSVRRPPIRGINRMGRYLRRGAPSRSEAVVLVLALIAAVALAGIAGPTQAGPHFADAGAPQAGPHFADAPALPARPHFVEAARRPRGSGRIHPRRSRAYRSDRVADGGLTRSSLLEMGSGYATGGSDAVRTLQRRLSGADCSPGPIDGLYGPLTERAVECFQATHGLVVDGIAGPVTLATMRTRPFVVEPGAGYGVPGGSPAVRVLQRHLESVGLSAGPIDGVYGPLTMRAVIRFQRDHRLSASGFANVRMQRALLRAGQAHSQAARRQAVGREAARRQAAERRAQPRPPVTIHSVPGSVPETTARRTPGTSTGVGHTPKVGNGGYAPASPASLLVLLAMVFLGLATAAVSYRQTHIRVKRARHRVPPGPPRKMSVVGAGRFGSPHENAGVDRREP